MLDVGLPDLDGLALQQRLLDDARRVPIVFITGHGDIPMTVRAIQAGAVNFLPKPFGMSELLRSVPQAVLLGAAPAAAAQAGARARVAALSDREQDVLARLKAGLRNKEVAAALGIAERTVKFHRAAIFKKLGVTSLAEAVTLLRDAAEAGAATKW